MSNLPPNLAQNSAVWGILEPILDTQVGVRDRSGNEITPPAPERKAAARALLQYMVDQRILFAIAMNLMKSKADRFPRDDLQVAQSMCALRIADFVQYSITRDVIRAEVINDTVRPTIGLLTQVAMLGGGKDLEREYRDQLTGTSTLWRRHRYAMQWQDELRHRLGHEPSTAELAAFFAERSRDFMSSSTKQDMTVTIADLRIPPRSESLDEGEFSDDDDEAMAANLSEDDQGAAEARIDAAVAIGLIGRAIRMWAPGNDEDRASMRSYVDAWVAIRMEPGSPEVVSVHSVVKLSGLPRRTATRMALEFDEYILPFVRDNLRPAQAQANVQRLELVDSIEQAVRAWAPGKPERQRAMRELINEWFRAGRLRLSRTVESLAKKLEKSRPETRELLEQFEEHILPVIERSRQLQETAN